MLIYRSGNAPAAGRGGICDLARHGFDHRQLLWRVVIRRRKAASVRYLFVAVADGDPTWLRSRLALTERLAVRLANTQADLLPTVRYLCQLLNACISGKHR